MQLASEFVGIFLVLSGILGVTNHPVLTEQLLNQAREWRGKIETFQGTYRFEVEIFRYDKGLPPTYTLEEVVYRFSGPNYFSLFTLLENRDGTGQKIGDTMQSFRFDGEHLFLANDQGRYTVEKNRRYSWPPDNALTPRMLLGHEPQNLWAWGNYLGQETAAYTVRQEADQYILWQLPDTMSGGGPIRDFRITIYFNQELLIEKIEVGMRPVCTVEEILQFTGADPFLLTDSHRVWEFADYQYFKGIPFPCTVVFTTNVYANMEEVNASRSKLHRGEISLCEQRIEEFLIGVVRPNMIQRVFFDPSTIVLNKPLQKRDFVFEIPSSATVIDYSGDDPRILVRKEPSSWRKHSDVIVFIVAGLMLLLVAIVTRQYWVRRF